MQVVILAAGHGKRFLSEGHMVPKPLLVVNGKRMIRRAMEQAMEVTNFPIVVCPTYLVGDLRIQTPEHQQTDFVPVKYVQQGAAMSLLTAACVLKDDEPVMVMDCDTIFAQGVLRRFSTFAVAAFSAGKDSALLCFKPTDKSSRYSFAKVSKDGVVAEVVEKVRISDVATCGVHAFATWAKARQAIYELVILDTKTNGEYYLAPAHNNLHHKVAMLIDSKEFTHVGTLAELEAYEQSVSKA